MVNGPAGVGRSVGPDRRDYAGVLIELSYASELCLHRELEPGENAITGDPPMAVRRLSPQEGNPS